MRNWTTDKERSVATLMGKHFRDYIGWRTETFLPNDRFQVIAYGPRFQSFDELLFEEAILGIEAEMGLKFPDSFWTQLFDSTFGDVVHAVIQEANQVMHPFEYK